MTDVNVQMQIRGNARQYNAAAGDQVQPVLGDGFEQIVNNLLPERAELVKLGKSWGAAIPTASAFTYVAAWPTTRSELVLYNGESSGGPVYVVDRVWMTTITAGGTGSNICLLGQLIGVGATGPTNVAPADNTSILRHQLSARNNNNYGGNAKLLLANTTWAIANQWFTLGNSNFAAQNNNLQIGQSVEAFGQGRYIIPPSAALCLAGLSSFAAGTAIIGVEWHEAYLNLT